MEISLQRKQGSEWTNDLGQTFPAAPLYRFVSPTDTSGCWYETLARAEASWNRRHPDHPASAVSPDVVAWVARP